MCNVIPYVSQDRGQKFTLSKSSSWVSFLSSTVCISKPLILTLLSSEIHCKESSGVGHCSTWWQDIHGRSLFHARADNSLYLTDSAPVRSSCRAIHKAKGLVTIHGFEKDFLEQLFSRGTSRRYSFVIHSFVIHTFHY